MATLYKKCPKCGADSAGLDTCAAEESDEESLLARAKELLFYIPEQTDPVFIYGRAILLAAIAFYGVKLALMDIPSWEMASSLIHLPMVPIHEFGYILFRPFGEFMTLLGGSLFQVLLPLIFGGVFLVKNRDPFAASVMLWWAAVAVMDVAPYIYDAWKPQHVLLTGRTGDTGAHDFIDTLGDLGLLHRAQPIGRGVHAFGVIAMLTALAWGTWLVWQQHRKSKSSTT